MQKQPPQILAVYHIMLFQMSKMDQKRLSNTAIFVKLINHRDHTTVAFVIVALVEWIIIVHG
jgi:hypothetical protein